MLLLEIFSDYQPGIVSVLVALIATVGLSFLFHPAIIVYYHEALEHTTTILTEPTKATSSEKDSKHEGVLLSLVIPSYNEEDRLPVMLDEAYEYLSKPKCPALDNLRRAYRNASKDHNTIPKILVEWVVSNDGSSDRTCQVFQEYVSKLEKISNNQPFQWKLVSLPYNEGKGAAVSVGMTESTGYYRLMVDADGATTFGAGLEAVTDELLKSSATDSTNQTIIFGSRAGDGAQRSAIRIFLMHSFLWLRSCVVGTPKTIRDTQCGFKLFDRPSAMRLFLNLHLRRWAFDIELVYVAMALGMKIKEVTVPWHEVDGSKLNTGVLALVWVSIGMLRDMVCVRACYVLGIWKIKSTS